MLPVHGGGLTPARGTKILHAVRCSQIKKKINQKTNDLNQTPYDYAVEVRHRFKGLDLIDRLPDELRTEVRDIV